MASLPVSIDDVRAAAALLDGVSLRTPVQECRALGAVTGGFVVLKCENLQRAGSFKIRGAYTRIARLSDAERRRGVVAASAGNHAQGVALAAGLLGTAATVFMPVGAPLPKIDATRGYGAHIEFVGSTVDECLTAALEHERQTGAVLIHPFDHADIVAGQGTVGLEILEQVPDVATIVVGTGGGGLLAGIATVVSALRPDVRVIGVQAAGAAAWPGSLAAGRPVPLDRMLTMADGIAVGRPGAVPFETVRQTVERILTVSEEDLSRALLLLLERAKLLVEPAGAAAVAGVMARPEVMQGPVVAVLSGGNIDPLLLMRVLRHGLAAAGRFLSVRLRISDAPGALAGLLADVAAAGASVVHVEHVRIDPGIAVGDVGVALQLETRGPEHQRQVVAALRAAGHDIVTDSAGSPSR